MHFLISCKLVVRWGRKRNIRKKRSAEEGEEVIHDNDAALLYSREKTNLNVQGLPRKRRIRLVQSEKCLHRFEWNTLHFFRLEKDTIPYKTEWFGLTLSWLKRRTHSTTAPKEGEIKGLFLKENDQTNYMQELHFAMSLLPFEVVESTFWDDSDDSATNNKVNFCSSMHNKLTNLRLWRLIFFSSKMSD